MKAQRGQDTRAVPNLCIHTNDSSYCPIYSYPFHVYNTTKTVPGMNNVLQFWKTESFCPFKSVRGRLMKYYYS
jgi:hypothetical protein